jgi:hypothetical protein
VKTERNAQFCLNLVNLYASSYLKDKALVEQSWAAIIETVILRGLYETNEENLELDFYLFELHNCFQKKIIQLLSVSVWLNFQSEIDDLMTVCNEISKLLSAPTLPSVITKRSMENTIETIGNYLLKSELGPEQQRLSAFPQAETSPEVKDFISFIVQAVA